MRIFALAVFAAALMAVTSAEAAEPEASEITRTIARQIEAFRRNDAAAAFAIAAPAIQKRFVDPATFMAMVAQGYPQVFRPRSIRFAEQAVRGDDAVQKVIVVGPDGVVVAALYQLVRIDGTWRINGCQIARLPGQDI